MFGRVPACLCGLVAIAALDGAVVTLRPIADTTLIEHDPTNNAGAQVFINSGSIANTPLRNRALLKFDLSSIPAGAIITNATLTVSVVGEPAGGGEASNFRLHRVLKPWSEGNKIPRTSPPGQGEPATTGEATWNARLHEQELWSQPGGAFGSDYSITPSSDVFVYGTGDSPYLFPSADALIADLRFWLKNPSQNFGWAMISASEQVTRTARRFGSREDEPNAPLLEVGYSVPGMLLENIRFDGANFRFEFTLPPTRATPC